MTTRLAPLLLALVLLGVLLAGCSSKAVTQSTASPSATTGTIRGVVVDSAIRPLGGVLVTLRAGSDQVSILNTTEGGLFRFDNVPAGIQVVKAHRVGYLDVQLQVPVQAGVAEPNETKVTLAIDPSYTKPYVQQPFKFDGIMECSVMANAPQPAGHTAVAACALPGQTTGVDVAPDKFIVVHPLDAGRPQFVQSELVWTPGGPLANQLQLYMDQRNRTASMSAGATGVNAGYYELERASGKSPVVVQVEGAAVQRLGNGYDLQLRVFAWYDDPQPVGAVFQQEFTLFSTVFYGFSPPTGWTFAATGEVPTPPA
ncbi:MAG TPA: carboxypeptidase-like regulatory domain-containing protein [Candidatus Thermoplasmatota archaeon]|nr:carboxypeptidase-like regulatory domain-containing protein [Candidatus Thermoplasmatota archaeon]